MDNIFEAFTQENPDYGYRVRVGVAKQSTNLSYIIGELLQDAN